MGSSSKIQETPIWILIQIKTYMIHKIWKIDTIKDFSNNFRIETPVEKRQQFVFFLIFWTFITLSITNISSSSTNIENIY